MDEGCRIASARALLRRIRRVRHRLFPVIRQKQAARIKTGPQSRWSISASSVQLGENLVVSSDSNALWLRVMAEVDAEFGSVP